MPVTVSKTEFSKIDLGTNSRKDMGDIDALAASIKTEGLLQPLIVRAAKNGKEQRYVLEAGYRRYEAIKQLRSKDKKAFDEVPVCIVKGNDDDGRFAQLAENIQRKDLNAIEQADSLLEMVNLGHDSGEIAERVGLTKTWIDRLLKVRQNCCTAVRNALKNGEISIAAAYEFVDLDEAKQKAALENYKDTKAKKGTKAAKKTAKKDAGKPVSPGKRTVNKLVAVIDEYAFEGDYWRGVNDALSYTLGDNEKLIDEVEAEASRRGIDLNGDGNTVSTAAAENSDETAEVDSDADDGPIDEDV